MREFNINWQQDISFSEYFSWNLSNLAARVIRVSGYDISIHYPGTSALLTMQIQLVVSCEIAFNLKP